MQTNELVELADEKGSPFWLAFGRMNRGCIWALTGKLSDGVQMLTNAINAHRSTGARHFLPWYLSILSCAYSELGQFDDAWRCIGEAMTAVGDRALSRLKHGFESRRERQENQTLIWY